MDPRRRRRAIVALAMLIGTCVAALEPVAGEVRDYITHYGDVQTVAHATYESEIGHAEVGQGEEGQHIKGFDHCSHAHGAAARGVSLSLRTVSEQPVSALVVQTAQPPEAPTFKLYHPPKA